MLQRSKSHERRSPMRPLRVVIEDPALADAATAPEVPGVEVRFCSGPTGEREVCPLVVGGGCPLGPCDVVVCDLDGVWASPIREAWARDGVLVTTSEPATSPRGLNHSVGSALKALWRAQYGTI